MKYTLAAYFLFFCLFTASRLRAQGVGSVEANSGIVTLASTDSTFSYAETLFFGPGTYTVDGHWMIYSKYIWIDPTATFSGTGVLEFYNPSDVGAAPSTTMIDANGVNLDVNVALYNSSNMVLADMRDPGYGNDNIGNASMGISKDLNLAVNNADVILGSIFDSSANSSNTPVQNIASTVTDLVFDAAATISNYSAGRMLVTSNSIMGHVVRLGNVTGFTFPVGIAEGDYTPAFISNNDGTDAVAVHVSVQDYTASASDEVAGSAGNGMQRSWHIFADASGSDWLIDLQHNSSTNQNTFDELSHFVTQWSAVAPNTTGDTALSSNEWQSNYPGAGSAGTVAGSSRRAHAFSALATSSGSELSYFTKSSNQLSPLPVVLLKFTAQATARGTVNLHWETSNEHNSYCFDVERSSDNIHWKKTGMLLSAGEGPQVNRYDLTDFHPLSGLSYYRLKQLDYNNAAAYSPARTVFFSETYEGAAFTLTLNPNPVKADSIRALITSGQAEEARVRIYDGTGMMLSEQTVLLREGASSVMLSLEAYATGVYYLQVQTFHASLVQKFLRVN